MRADIFKMSVASTLESMVCVLLVTRTLVVGEEATRQRSADAGTGGVYDVMHNFCASSASASDACIAEPLRVGAWNLQRFGVAKMADEKVVQRIVEVMALYDMMVMQEVTDSTSTSVPALLTALNQHLGGAPGYVAVESPRIGRTSHKEQYVIVYKPSRLTFLEGYKYADPADIFQVEPFIAHFSLNTTEDVAEFAVIPLHAKGNDAPHELDALVDVYDEMVAYLGIEDAIILGDFNAGCDYVRQSEFDEIRLHKDPRFHWLISDHEDTTTKSTSCPYDRIVLAGSAIQKSAYYMTASAFYFDEAFGIEANVTLVEDISDHYPVGVMLRGTVPPSAHAMYGGDWSSSSQAGQEIRVSLSADLPLQESWVPVSDMLSGASTQHLASNASPPPEVAVVAGIAYAEWRVGDVAAALALVAQLSAAHPSVVPKETAAVLGYKAGHRAMDDASMYTVGEAPQQVVASVVCRPHLMGARCCLSLSARTGIN